MAVEEMGRGPMSMLAPRDPARAPGAGLGFGAVAPRWQLPDSIAAASRTVVGGIARGPRSPHEHSPARPETALTRLAPRQWAGGQHLGRESSAEATIAEEAAAAQLRQETMRPAGRGASNAKAGEGGPPSQAGTAKGGGGGGARGGSRVSQFVGGKGVGNRSKLVIHYAEGESPMNDLVRLGGGQGMDVLVEAVAADSKAEKAGVKPGFALTAMNGRSEFMQLPGWQVRLLLDAPITLGFDPDPVKPQSTKCTEIRLTRAQDQLGIPPRVAVCGPRDKGVLAEEVVFKPGSAPLWISAWGDESISEAPEVAASSGAVRRVYELRRPEAHAIVGHAIRGARALSPDCELPVDNFEADWFTSTGSRAPRRMPRVSLCSLDCVAECVDNDVVVDRLLCERDRGGDAVTPDFGAATAAGDAAAGRAFLSSTAEGGGSSRQWFTPALGPIFGSAWGVSSATGGLPRPAEPVGSPRGIAFGPRSHAVTPRSSRGAALPTVGTIASNKMADEGKSAGSTATLREADLFVGDPGCDGGLGGEPERLPASEGDVGDPRVRLSIPPLGCQRGQGRGSSAATFEQSPETPGGSATSSPGLRDIYAVEVARCQI